MKELQYRSIYEKIIKDVKLFVHHVAAEKLN